MKNETSKKEEKKVKELHDNIKPPNGKKDP